MAIISSAADHAKMSSDTKLYTKLELIEKFGWEEYLIFAMMLSVSAFIGLYFWWQGKRNKAENNAEFLMGGKSMGVLPVSLSLLARWTS